MICIFYQDIYSIDAHVQNVHKRNPSVNLTDLLQWKALQPSKYIIPLWMKHNFWLKSQQQVLRELPQNSMRLQNFVWIPISFQKDGVKLGLSDILQDMKGPGCLTEQHTHERKLGHWLTPAYWHLSKWKASCVYWVFDAFSQMNDWGNDFCALTISYPWLWILIL